MQGFIDSHLVVIGPCKKIRDPDWMKCCGVGPTHGLINFASKPTNEPFGMFEPCENLEQPPQTLQTDEGFSFSFFCCEREISAYLSLVFTLQPQPLCDVLQTEGSVCLCVRRVHYQGNPSPSVLSASPKLYSRAGRDARRKGSFFRPSWLAAKGQSYLRLWLLRCFCLAPPIEDRKWAWGELNTAPSRFSSPRGGYSHRKVKLSDTETQ